MASSSHKLYTVLSRMMDASSANSIKIKRFYRAQTQRTEVRSLRSPVAVLPLQFGHLLHISYGVLNTQPGMRSWKWCLLEERPCAFGDVTLLLVRRRLWTHTSAPQDGSTYLLGLVMLWWPSSPRGVTKLLEIWTLSPLCGELVLMGENSEALELKQSLAIVEVTNDLWKSKVSDSQGQGRHSATNQLNIIWQKCTSYVSLRSISHNTIHTFVFGTTVSVSTVTLSSCETWDWAPIYGRANSLQVPHTLVWEIIRLKPSMIFRNTHCV